MKDMNLGMPEMIFIFLLALILFGPKKLPEIGREIGKALNEFKRASNEFRSQLESEIDQLDVDKQRDYYRERAEQLAREAQQAFSIDPPKNPGIANTPIPSPGNAFKVEGYPPVEEVKPAQLTAAPDEIKSAEAPAPIEAPPEVAEPLKGTNV